MSVGVSPFVSELVMALITVIYFCISMAGFVFGVTFVFGVLEEVGIVSRVSYVFDNTMARFGLQGKVIMPFMMSAMKFLDGSIIQHFFTEIIQAFAASVPASRHNQRHKGGLHRFCCTFPPVYDCLPRSSR